MINDKYTQILKEKNLSLTAVRLSLLDAIEKNPHCDANLIISKVRDSISTATIQAVYNNLNALTDAGLIREIKPKGQSSLYETRINDNHHHIICRNCGAIEDTNCLGCAPCLSPSHHHGFAIDEAEIVFWGICPHCQKSHNNHKKEKIINDKLR